MKNGVYWKQEHIDVRNSYECCLIIGNLENSNVSWFRLSSRIPNNIEPYSDIFCYVLVTLNKDLCSTLIPALIISPGIVLMLQQAVGFSISVSFLDQSNPVLDPGRADQRVPAEPPSRHHEELARACVRAALWWDVNMRVETPPLSPPLTMDTLRCTLYRVVHIVSVMRRIAPLFFQNSSWGWWLWMLSYLKEHLNVNRKYCNGIWLS